MKKTIEPGETPPTFNPEALYTKAVLYIQNMAGNDSDTWEYALWSSLALEFLARAALANVSPALLAETDKNGSNLCFALGFTPFEEKFSPRSIAISDVFKRLSGILAEFTKEHESFGVVHTGRRNAELHTGELAFEGVKGSTWQPRFYQTCEILLTSMGIPLEEFVGKDEAEVAKKLIDAAADESAKAVKGDVEAHKKVWNAKSDDERTTLQAQAAVWATRQNGHRVDCPSCASTALVAGEPVSAPTQKLDSDEIIETQEYLPTNFECVACSLKIAGLSKLAVVGLSDRYRKTRTYDAAEYYAPADDWSNYEDDNNER
ncbi:MULTISPECIES: hypothetical protein [Shinella]|uniref:Uncharacterized protein n=1 Tax=Shinella sumterensis TaxID=1967501 RepID=A0AA50CR91_9HYPH|nr:MULTISPECIES: hypothetical protein [Shinella]MDC7259500.1 hypothetical protein [Shinella sp. YE25]WLS00613.1 hypothetical protein Q9313_24895 [Shinella sumterensis]CAI0341272.1 conserved hypothetical protein [Rhizobiaceae bacterium]CAK7260913.1 conserved protein of unknown function [Shinella sp. WSC3-e]